MSAAQNQHIEYLRQFQSHRYEAFQDWFGKLARALHGEGNFQEIRKTQGDGAIDGFVINSQLVYQVYAPARMDELRDSVTAAKMKADFQTAYSRLGGQLKQWVFVHNHPEPKIGQLSTAAISELKTEHPDIRIEVLDISSLWERLKNLPRDVLEQHFGKSLSADSLRLNVFDSLNTLFERMSRSIVFPSATLFEKGLTFFLKEESSLMNEIEAVLDGSGGERLALLRGAGISFLMRRIHDERFEGIAAGLYDIFKCDEAFGREVLSQLDVRFLEAKAKLEQFDRICQAMNRLATIDRRKAEELVKRFNPSWLAERAAALPADRLGGCLSEMAEVNANFAKAVLHAHGQKRVTDSLQRLTGPRFRQATSTLRKIDPAFIRNIQSRQAR